MSRSCGLNSDANEPAQTPQPQCEGDAGNGGPLKPLYGASEFEQRWCGSASWAEDDSISKPCPAAARLRLPCRMLSEAASTAGDLRQAGHPLSRKVAVISRFTSHQHARRAAAVQLYDRPPPLIGSGRQ